MNNQVQSDLALAQKLKHEDHRSVAQIRRDAILGRNLLLEEQSLIQQNQQNQRDADLAQKLSLEEQKSAQQIHDDAVLARSLFNDAPLVTPIGVTVYEPEEIHLQDGFLLFKCPHCKSSCFVFEDEINCTIFVHAVTMAGQVYQHLKPEQLRDLRDSKTVIAGCAIQYEIISLGNGVYKAKVCYGR